MRKKLLALFMMIIVLLNAFPLQVFSAISENESALESGVAITNALLQDAEGNEVTAVNPMTVNGTGILTLDWQNKEEVSTAPFVSQVPLPEHFSYSEEEMILLDSNEKQVGTYQVIEQELQLIINPTLETDTSDSLLDNPLDTLLTGQIQIPVTAKAATEARVAFSINQKELLTYYIVDEIQQDDSSTVQENSSTTQADSSSDQNGATLQGDSSATSAGEDSIQKGRSAGLTTFANGPEIIKLTGPLKPKTAVLQIQVGGEWVDYDKAKHPPITEKTSIRLSYFFDIQKYLDSLEGQLDKAAIENANPGQEIVMEFSFLIDGIFALSKDFIDVPITNASGNLGSFTIEKAAGTNQNHLWTVNLTTNAFNKSGVTFKMELTSTVTFEEDWQEVEKKIAICDDESVLVELKRSNTTVSLEKSCKTVGGTPIDKIKTGLTYDAYPIVWEVTITPPQNPDNVNEYLPLTDIVLKDSDDTYLFDGGSQKGHGFEFLKNANGSGLNEGARTILAEYGGGAYPLLQVTDGATIFELGDEKDYTVNFYEGPMLIKFAKDKVITKPITITFTTISSAIHPTDEIVNKVTLNGKAGGKEFPQLTATAKTSLIYRHEVIKTGTNQAGDTILWQVVYYRSERIKESFADEFTLGTGEFDIGSIRVIDEHGEHGVQGNIVYSNEHQTSGISVVPGANNQSFTITFADTVPVGRYVITYKSKHAEGVTKVKNGFVGGELKTEAEVDVTKKIGLVKHLLSGENWGWDVRWIDEEKQIVPWLIQLETEPGAEITLKDNAISKNLVYYYDENVIPKDGKLLNVLKLEEIKDYLHEKGMIFYYEAEADDEDGNYKEGDLVEITKEVEIILGNVQFESSAPSGSYLTDVAWQASRAGFTATIPADYAGKKLFAAIATKYGNVDPLDSQLSPSWYNAMYNGAEVIQDVDDVSLIARGMANYTPKDIEEQTAIIKKGALAADGKTIDWDVLANTRRFTLKAGYILKDTLSVTKGVATQQFTEADVNKLAFYLYSYGNSNETSIYEKFTKGRQLTTDEYTIEAVKDSSKRVIGFKMTLLKNIAGNYAIGYQIASQITMGEETNEDGQTKVAGPYDFKNDVVESHKTQGGTLTNTTHATVTVTADNGYLYKTAGEFDNDTDRIPWSIAVNPNGKTLSNLVVQDIPDDYQAVDLDTVKVYQATWGNNKTVVKPNETPGYILNQTAGLVKGDSLSPTLYKLEGTASNGFKLSFSEGVTVTQPLIIEYESVVGTSGTITVENGARLDATGVEYEMEKVTKTVIVSGANGSGNGRLMPVQVKKVAAGTEEDWSQRAGLTGAKFKLEVKSGDSWISKGEVTVDKNGQIDYRLMYGDYRLTETEAPEDYQGTTEVFYFKISASGVEDVTQGDPPKDYDDYRLKAAATTDSAIIYVQNEPVVEEKYQLQVKKCSSLQEGDTAILLDGAVFSLYEEGGEEPLQTKETESGGIATFTNLDKAKTYLLKETKAPLGYISTNQTYTLKWGTDQWQLLDEDEQKVALTVSEKDDNHLITLTAIIENDPITGQLPATGGNGTLIYRKIFLLLFSLMFLLIGVFLFLNRRQLRKRLSKWMSLGLLLVVGISTFGSLPVDRGVFAAEKDETAEIVVHKQFLSEAIVGQGVGKVFDYQNDGTEIQWGSDLTQSEIPDALREATPLNGAIFSVYDATTYYYRQNLKGKEFVDYLSGLTNQQATQLAGEEKMTPIASSPIVTGDHPSYGSGVATIELPVMSSGRAAVYLLIETEVTEEAGFENTLAQESSPLPILFPVLDPVDESTPLSVIHLYPKNIGYLRMPYFFKYGGEQGQEQLAKPLAGVQFALYRLDSQGEKLYLTRQTATGSLRNHWLSSQQPLKDEAIVKFVSNKAGLVTTAGYLLPSGTYYFEEIQTLAGYQITPDTQEIEIVIPNHGQDAAGNPQYVTINGQQMPDALDDEIPEISRKAAVPRIYNFEETKQGQPKTPTKPTTPTAPKTPITPNRQPLLPNTASSSTTSRTSLPRTNEQKKQFFLLGCLLVVSTVFIKLYWMVTEAKDKK